MKKREELITLGQSSSGKTNVAVQLRSANLFLWDEIALFIPLQSDAREIYDYCTHGGELFNELRAAAILAVGSRIPSGGCSGKTALSQQLLCWRDFEVK